MCRLADFALIRRCVCLLGVTVKSASQGRLTQRRRQVFPLPPLPPHSCHLARPLTEHFLHGPVLSPTNLKFL